MMNELIQAAAQAALAQRFRTEIRLEAIEALVDYKGANCHIYRCSVDGQLPGSPQTVVVKYAVSRSKPLVREWVAYDFLASAPQLQAHLPRHFVTDPSLEYSVMEDLGARQNGLLGEILFQDSRDRAEAALLEFVRLLAAIHTATRGRSEVWARQMAARGAGGPTRHKVFRIGETLGSFGALSARLGLPLSPQAGAELADIRARLAQPGPFLALTHGDSTPANFMTRNGRSWLLDWETADFRHCLLDGTYSLMRDLHSVWAMGIPGAFRWQMFEAYRQALGEGMPEALDDGVFYHHFAACSLAWLGGLLDFYDRVSQTDDRWGRSTLRQRIFNGLRQVGTLEFIQAYYPGLFAFSGKLRAFCEMDWPQPDRHMALFPAFERAG